MEPFYKLTRDDVFDLIELLKMCHVNTVSNMVFMEAERKEWIRVLQIWQTQHPKED